MFQETVMVNFDRGNFAAHFLGRMPSNFRSNSSTVFRGGRNTGSFFMKLTRSTRMTVPSANR